MLHNKPWINGPYNITYPPCLILYSQENNKKESSSKINTDLYKTDTINLINKSISNKKENITIKSCREASVKSHQLFLWESKKLTII